MSSSREVRSAVDAVRCLYLARVTERAGHHDAARRWQRKAAEWIDRHLAGKSTRPSPASESEVAQGALAMRQT